MATVPTSMKAWQYSSTVGGMEKNLKLNASAALPPSTLKPDQTLVQVLSMSFNPVDFKMAEVPLVGRLLRKPASPGLDYCGRVVTAGTSVAGVLKPGQLVFGRLDGPTQFGTLGQYIISGKEGTVPLPKGLTADKAASIGTAGITAYQSIIPYAKKGDRIFINGGSGGTGTWGIQMGKLLGCHVTTSCSTLNVELCKKLGADEVIDYKKDSVVEKLKHLGPVFDLVVDNVGEPADLYKHSHHFTKPTGSFVQIGAPVSISATVWLLWSMAMPGFLGGGKRKSKLLLAQTSGKDLAEIGNWVAEGKIEPVIDEAFRFEDAVKALEKLKTGRTKGKIVVHVVE